MIGIVFKAIGIWFVIVIAAILNGLFREKVLVSLVGAKLALPLSGILLSILVLFVSFMLIRFLNSSEQSTLFATGFLWVVLTLSFELLFGYFVVGKSWYEIIQVFSLHGGDLFLLVLFITAIAPWVSAKARGIL